MAPISRSITAIKVETFSSEAHRYMARALRLARRGLYTTEPNPRVGCVLVRDGQVVGEGYHQRAGGPHAERVALAAAGEQARGATAYVTLEPCCHTGRTPPCSEALIAAGVAQVVCAMTDPNPLVAGKGLAQLRRAGLLCHAGLLAEQARALNPGFIQRMERGRPFVRCKLAMSLDGRTALASGESKWITGEAARRDVHRLRARSSAILTGSGTLLADDPSLDVRLPPAALGLAAEAELPRPLRVVLDTTLRTPPSARLLTLPGRTLLLTRQPATTPQAEILRRHGAEVVTLPANAEGRLDLPAVLHHLASEQVNELLLECGPTLAGAALQAGVVDELILYVAPHLLGSDGRGLLHLPGLTSMTQRIALEWRDLRRVGEDLRICCGVRATLSSTGDVAIE